MLWGAAVLLHTLCFGGGEQAVADPDGSAPQAVAEANASALRPLGKGYCLYHVTAEEFITKIPETVATPIGAAPGQTIAAHRLCSGLAASKQKDLLQKGVGHYGIFNGRRWRERICPEIGAFIREHG